MPFNWIKVVTIKRKVRERNFYICTITEAVRKLTFILIGCGLFYSTEGNCCALIETELVLPS